MSGSDVIIVGAGSAGCALAGRLSEDPDTQVVLLEAGGDDSLEAIHQPSMWPTLWGSEVDWAYETVRQPNAGNQIHQWPRGKVIGGSSSLNGMVYIRGNRADFDAWGYRGCSGWSYEQLLPVFKRMEDVPAGDPKYRGAGGPIQPRPAASPNPISTAFVEAAREQSHPITADFNAEQFEGAGYHDLLIKDGQRQSAADAYLHPSASRENLRVITRASVHKLLFSGDRCIGVRYLHDGQVEDLHGGEIVLSAGAIDSPALLMRSGIGAADELASAGVEAVHDLPGVGRNLHDHLLMGVLWEAAQPVPPPEYNLAEASMFARSHAGSSVPDLHLMFIHVPFHLPSFAVPDGCWTIAVGLVRPASRGAIRLASAGGGTKPVIDPGYLTEQADLDAMVAGLQQARELASAQAFDPWRGAEALPGEAVDDSQSVRDFVRRAAGTYYHPVGTCRMGVGPDAVVDPRLRVRGLENLRVADASIMPEIVSANTNTTTLMIGEKAAELLRDSASIAAAGKALVAGE